MKDKCCFCGEDLDGIGDIGHNAEPLKDGRCCTKCNEELVIPKRTGELEIKFNDLLKR